MFLVTTPITDKDEIDGEKIYLNELSRKNINKEVSRFDILPYHWKNLNAAKKDANYVYDFFYELLKSFSLKLDQYHKTSFGVRYWQILIGPWLYYFLIKYYDHYLSIFYALNIEENFSVNITNLQYTPHTYTGYIYINKSNMYTSLIYEEILINFKEKKNIKFLLHKTAFREKLESIELKWAHFEHDRNFVTIIKRNLRNIRNKIYQLSSNSEIAILSLDSKNLDQLMKKIGINKFKHFYDLKNVFAKLNQKCNLDNNFRSEKINIATNDDFKKIVYKNILKHIPVEYVENYQQNRNNIKKVVSKETKLAIVKCPVVPHSFNRFFLSEVINNKGKILSMQHGGSYGARDIIGVEQLEIDLCDKYLTWGWKAKSKNTIPFFVTKNVFIKDYKYNKNGDILFVGASCKNYFYSFDEGQLPNHNNAYLENAIKFIDGLNKSTFNNLIYRFYFQENFNEYKYVKKKFPNIKTSLREKNSHFYDLFYQSKLMITTNDATTHKEGFIVNHPTIMLLVKDFFNFREEAIPYYEALFEAGILYYSPIECAKKINSISNNPLDWWNQSKVQEAKDYYNQYFCKTSNKYNDQLANIIKSML